MYTFKDLPSDIINHKIIPMWRVNRLYNKQKEMSDKYFILNILPLGEENEDISFAVIMKTIINGIIKGELEDGVNIYEVVQSYPHIEDMYSDFFYVEYESRHIEALYCIINDRINCELWPHKKI